MGLRPIRIVTSVLELGERKRILTMAPFKSSNKEPGDDHLIHLGILRDAGLGHINLTRAGRVIRRLLQELEQCSVASA